MTGRAVFPGSFDPFSVAHLAIVDAAHSQLDVAVVCALSVDPLGKTRSDQSPLAQRVDAIARLGAGRPWLDVTVTERRHLADIAAGFDWLVVGADKWEQLHDVAFYDDAAAMARSLAALPAVAFVPRDGVDGHAPVGVTVLDVAREFSAVSSTAIRAGKDEWRARP